MYLLMLLTGAKFKTLLESYFRLFDGMEVHTLEDLVQFNKQHAGQELPSGEPAVLLRP